MTAAFVQSLQNNVLIMGNAVNTNSQQTFCSFLISTLRLKITFEKGIHPIFTPYLRLGDHS